MFGFKKKFVPRVTVLLIAPSSYDDDGFVIRFWKGVIATCGLITMADLTRRALKSFLPKKARFKVKMYEDSIFLDSVLLGFWGSLWFVRSLFWSLLGYDSKLIVGFVSVQSHQFQRTADLIKRWQRRGATCVIGGPHVTASISAMKYGIGDRGEGSVPCPHKMPSEIIQLQERGVIVFHGEAEPHLNSSSWAWQDLLADIVHGIPCRLYRGGCPDMSRMPLPEVKKKKINFFARRMVPVNTSRGCPFKCKFCSVVTMQGRRMRCRLPEIITDYFVKLCCEHGCARVFITDDNFARSRYRDEALETLARMRETGSKISFMVQADVDACIKDKELISRLARAGCVMIFFGIESLNQKNLEEAGKKQNLKQDLGELFAKCHENNIIVHASYMIGFQHDTARSVAKEVDQLFSCGADHASFYIRGPVPGCEDWIRLIDAGVEINPDMDTFDSEHCVTAYGLNMDVNECEKAYRDAWQRFYTLPNMKKARQRFSDKAAKWDLLRVHLWYWWATNVECLHPMQCGFYRFRPYWDRREGASSFPLAGYFWQELTRHCRYVLWWLKALIVFERIEFDRSRLNDFWARYARNRWRLLHPVWGFWWHLRAVSHALTEVVYVIRSGFRFLEIIRTVRA